MELVEGQIVGRYELKSRIANGGMSAVFNAFDPLLKRYVALKILRKELIGHSKDFLAMFDQEANLTAKLEHPNILPIYDFGEFQGLPYAVFRLATCGTLEERLRKEALSPLEVIKLIERIASAIDYFHEKGIVHRDLKPANILLGEQNHPYISDFGIAFIPESFKEITTGSPLYMAPEQWTSNEPNYKSDLFALGLIIFQCFTGRYPIPNGLDVYNAPKIKEYRTSTNNKQLPLLRDYVPNLPVGVDVVLDRLTRFAVDERFSSATEAADALLHAFFSGQTQVTGKVFISYAHSDKDYVHRLARQMMQIGINIWIDQNLLPGRNWDRNIENALNECTKILVILSPESVASENVNDEWSYFLEQGKEVYQLLYKDCNIPFRLRRRQYISSSGDIFIDSSNVINMLSGGNPNILIEGVRTQNANLEHEIQVVKKSDSDLSATKMSDVEFLNTSTGAYFGSPEDTIGKLGHMPADDLHNDI